MKHNVLGVPRLCQFFAPPRSRSGSKRQACPKMRSLPTGSQLSDYFLSTKSAGEPPHEVRRYYASFRYQAQTWSCSRRVVAKVEWHPGELYPRVGFLVTNLCRPPERVVAFYNQRGTAEQWIKEGKNAAKWTRL